VTAYVVVQITVENQVVYERYKRLAPPSIAAHGGRYLARGGKSEVLEGAWQPSRLVVLEFPSPERARAWWNSPEYAEAKSLRRQSAHTDMRLIEGSGPADGPMLGMAATELAERVRAALMEMAIAARQDARVRGLCAEGAFEAAVSAMRACDLGEVAAPHPAADSPIHSRRPS
jgi:uncharacterized protein (DUF1330 family)